jgi:ribosomal protein S18 acetylase RimI-like enzyme
VTLSSRPASTEDEPFVRRLIIETLTEQLGAASWPEATRTHLLEVQYAARRQGAGGGFPAGTSRIIVVNGQDAGWTLVADLAHEVRLLEIMVLGEYRGAGIGTAAINGVIGAAARSGKPVRLHVDAGNARAIALYERLGFRLVESNGILHLMERMPTTG